MEKRTEDVLKATSDKTTIQLNNYSLKQRSKN